MLNAQPSKPHQEHLYLLKTIQNTLATTIPCQI